jgi:hypothetical protein
MAAKINLIANCDDAVVFWGIEKPIKDCWGFAVERERSVPGGGVQGLTLDNRVGFEKDNPQPGDHRPSTVWPFQRFWWADHSVNSGDRVRYRVTPMVYALDHLVEQVDGRSSWTKWTELSDDAGDGMSSFFNRGLVISQFMARYLEKLRQAEGLATRETRSRCSRRASTTTNCRSASSSRAPCAIVCSLCSSRRSKRTSMFSARSTSSRTMNCSLRSRAFVVAGTSC